MIDVEKCFLVLFVEGYLLCFVCGCMVFCFVFLIEDMLVDWYRGLVCGFGIGV